MTHWSKFLVLSGATCVATLGYVLYNEKEKTSEEGELSDPEESGLISQLRPPAYIVKLLKVSLATSGAYLFWRLFKTMARVITFYGFSLGTLLLNKTAARLGNWKLGSIMAATGCFFTTAYFMQAVGSEVGWFLFCNALVSAPAVYCISQKMSTRQELISRQLTSIRDSDQLRGFLNTFSQENLEAQWVKYDPNGRGLEVEEVKVIVDELVGNALNRGVDALENQCQESIPMRYIVGAIVPYLKDLSRVEKLSGSIFEKIEMSTNGRIYKEEFMTISETSGKALKELFSQSMSISGAIGLARKFNSIGD